jgi:hypothetical protein
MLEKQDDNYDRRELNPPTLPGQEEEATEETASESPYEELQRLREENARLKQEFQEFKENPDTYTLWDLKERAREAKRRRQIETYKADLAERYDIPVEALGDLSEKEGIDRRAMEYLHTKAEQEKAYDTPVDDVLVGPPLPTGAENAYRPRGDLDTEMARKAEATGKSTLDEWLKAGGGKVRRGRTRRSRV